MHAVKNGIIALGIGVCLSSTPVAAQSRPAPQSAVAPAVAYRDAAPGAASQGAVRQVAGRQSPASQRTSKGLIGSWLSSSDDAAAPRREPQSLFERLGISGQPEAPAAAAPAAATAPDWSGVPYHRPQRTVSAAAGAPITDPADPSNRGFNRGMAASSTNARTTAGTPAQTRANSRTTANPPIPVPPAEGSARVSRREMPAAELPQASASSRRATAAAPTAGAASYGDLSETESSRRRDRRVVDPLDAYLSSDSSADSQRLAPAAPPVRADGQGPIADRGLADGPRVARRPVPPVNSADSSRRRAAMTPGTSVPPSLAAAANAATPQSAASQPTAEPTSQPTTEPAASIPAEADSVAATEPTADDGVALRPVPKRQLGLAAPATNGSASAKAEVAGDSTTAAPQVGSDQGRAAAEIAAAAAAGRPAAAAAAGEPTTEPAAASPSLTPSDDIAGSGNASPALPAQGDTWRASGSAADRAATTSQLGVSPRAAVDGPIEPSQNVTRVNRQPVNVVAEIPGIRVVTSGPAEIPIRQSVDYQISVENMGTIAAPGTLVRVTLPGWIGVEKQHTTRGEIVQEKNQREQQLLWQVEGLAAGRTETVTLSLSAVEARPFDVAVEWAVLPQSNVAHVQVYEPKLELLIEGPDQVVYGQSQSYKVRVLNPGNGHAEEVVFTLSPKSSTPQSQRIGSIPAGKEAHFEVELTARERENLEIHGLAIGARGLETELVKSIQVIAADLEAVLSGPPLRYQDAAAQYKLEITNHGEARCEQLAAVLQLPTGVVYQEGIEAAQVSGGTLQWIIPQLAAGETVEYDFRCLMEQTGEQEIAFQCQGTAAGTASVAFTTSVEALADLVLAINDPPAPAAVGEEVTYELVIRNRGSKAATDVQALAQFSNDVEPVRVDGGNGELAPGQAMFDAISRIEPGQEVRLRVIAKADKAGLHRFRAEVKSGEMLLISEEATRYIELDGQRVSRRSGDDRIIE